VRNYPGPVLKLLKRNLDSGSLSRLCDGYFLLRVGEVLKKKIDIVFFPTLILRIGESPSLVVVVLLLGALFCCQTDRIN